MIMMRTWRRNCGTFELDDEDERRKDRSKDTKFKNLLKNQCLPAWLADEWRRTPKMKSGRYEAQRMLVNSAIDRGPSGTLTLNPDKIELNKIKAGCCLCLISLLVLLIRFACAGCFMCVIIVPLATVLQCRVSCNQRASCVHTKHAPLVPGDIHEV